MAAKRFLERNPTYIRESYIKENENPLYYYRKRVLTKIKTKCKKKKIPFSLSPEDIIIPEFCPVLGLKLDLTVGTKGHGFKRNSPSIDRINPKGGYTPDNIRIISARANVLKCDASIEELEKVLKDLKSFEDYTTEIIV